MIVLILILVFFLPIQSVFSFCGFYVARADATLYNNASRVVITHNGDRTVTSMMNDYKGPLKEFAIVVPVPVVLQKDQIHIGESKIIDHLDAYSAPRLVEYFDPDPCRKPYKEDFFDRIKKSGKVNSSPPVTSEPKKDLGVTVEATYTVGEYDIQILSAKFSDGLEEWLTSNGYKLPKGASKALEPYIKQKLKFFVAKVNLEEQTATGLTFLRPIQFAYESERFMLPIRLGMINSNGPQELLIYILSKNGRVETTNYRSVKLPSNLEVPGFVKNEFSDFYKAMFDYQSQKEKRKVVFTEYFWNMGWCDPCAADPLTNQELQSLGVFWLDNKDQMAPRVFITRLHLSYTNETFPEDLFFQETNDTSNFQGRYIIQHPWKGNRNSCSAAENYFDQLYTREENRAKNLAHLTGWDINTIRSKMNINIMKTPEKKEAWWKKIWN